MDQEAVCVIEGKELTKLLDCPFSGPVLGHVAVQNATGTNFHCDEDVDQPE